MASTGLGRSLFLRGLLVVGFLGRSLFPPEYSGHFLGRKRGHRLKEFHVAVSGDEAVCFYSGRWPPAVKAVAPS